MMRGVFFRHDAGPQQALRVTRRSRRTGEQVAERAALCVRSALNGSH